MEQIYTIPVNEAFDLAKEKALGEGAEKTPICPLCHLRETLNEGELERILGAAMMEPDVRIETNREGFCGMPADPVLARAALHFDEEPVISGKTGSGTVFFSGCSLKCCFCQNFELSHHGFGKKVTVERLREIYFELIAQGVHID